MQQSNPVPSAQPTHRIRLCPPTLLPYALQRNQESEAMLLSLIRMFQSFRDYQRNVAELSQLTDRELADMGLDRSDIPRVAAGNYNG